MECRSNNDTNSLYIHLVNCASVDSVELAAGVVLDYDINGVAVGIDVQQVSQRTDLNNEAVKFTYLEKEDIFQVHRSYRTIARAASPDWHTNISCAEDGTTVQIVLLDAKKEDLLPVEFRKACLRTTP